MGVIAAGDIQSIKGNMASINGDITGMIGKVYTKLFSDNPDVHAMFNDFKGTAAGDIASNPKFAGFASEFAKDLTKLTESAESDDAFKKWVDQSRARHIPKRNVKKEQYQVVLSTIGAVMGNPAWDNLGKAVTAAM